VAENTPSNASWKADVLKSAEVKGHGRAVTQAPLRDRDHVRAGIDGFDAETRSTSNSVSFPVPQPTSKIRDPLLSSPRSNVWSISEAG
jgi:hypothetical protein